MGFGDPYHNHPLRRFLGERVPPSTNCFHCELPITNNYCYGCEDCNYYIHSWCQDLPTKLRLPHHDQHLLTLFESPSNSSFSSNSPNILCNECQNPCLGRFAYQCTTCQYFFHLNCLFTLKLEKHEHPLIYDYAFEEDCEICGTDIRGFVFCCNSCEFYIHHECSLIPLEIKHHHVHILILRHNFPEECDQVYCDRCEDRDGEMDRKESYYYCKDCDYIAHVNCCIAQPREDVLICERFTHEHPLRPNKTERLLSCTQCSYTVSKYTNEYPFSVKHPRHPHHTLLFDSEPTDGECNFNCTECNFSMDRYEFVKFTHPLWRERLEFICKNSLFRCDACGELGKGSRIKSIDDGRFDIHLECFALPGKLEHESHPNHPLYLRWLDESTSRCCSICREEMDPQLWLYFCQECNYAAHMDCVARDLLSKLQSSIINRPEYCAVIEPDKSSFKYADMGPGVIHPSYSGYLPVLEVFTDDDEGNYDLGSELDGYELPCPKCSSLIPTQAGYSSIKDWKSSFLKDGITAASDQIPSESESLSSLNEQIIDELFCSICNMLIFPPTYSCASCQIFFHKSCAELPRKIIFNGTTYVLMAPPFPEGLSNCTFCKNPIYSWAYCCSVEGIIFDVQCSSGAPLVNRTHNNHSLSSKRVRYRSTCGACKTELEVGIVMMDCVDCGFDLHPECGLLPPVVTNDRIHWHSLELATDLAELDCEYFCDVCEKDLNPDLWAYRCMDICGIWATSHVSCVISSKKKCHFSYDDECQKWTEGIQQTFRRKAKERGERTIGSTSEHVASDDDSTSLGE